MQSRSKKKENVKPLASIVQTVPAEKLQMAPASSLLVTTQQPRGIIDQATLEQELQAIRQGTHQGFLRQLDTLDQSQQEAVLQVHRLKEERMRNLEEMFVAEMQAVEDDYLEQAENLRDKMVEELIASSQDKTKSSDVVTRGKKNKLTAKDDRPKKKANIKGIKYTLTNDEINGDLESIRQQMHGLGNNTRSKSKIN